MIENPINTLNRKDRNPQKKPLTKRIGISKPVKVRVSNLLHEVEQAISHSTPIQRRHCVTFHLQTHVGTVTQVLLGANICPQLQIVYDLLQLEVGPVAK